MGPADGLISAHDLVQTRDCVFPMCTRDAEVGDYCLVHCQTEPPPANGSAAASEEPERRCLVELAPGVVCGEDAAGSPTRGPYSNKCPAHRAEMAKRLHPSRVAAPAAPETPPLSASGSFRARAKILVRVGTKVDQAIRQRAQETARLEQQQAAAEARCRGLDEAVEAAMAEWRAACEALAA